MDARVTVAAHPNERIIVALSGGVDSAVAALLMKRQGYVVSGVFMKNWEDDDTESDCPSREDLIDAVAVAERVGIDIEVVNFAAEYRERVFSRFLAELQAGRTPNPDVLCNREVKFKACLDHALSLGGGSMATGHYARIAHRDGQLQLLRGIDPAKDQSYFLYMLGQAQLAHSVFPIGSMRKSEVRAAAAEARLTVHDKRDSTGICFIGERRFRPFLSRYLPITPGEIRSLEGEVIGKHPGVVYYTLGQREGLGIGGVKGALEAPWYVLEKDLKNNVLVVGQGHDHPRLLSTALEASSLHWVAGRAPMLPLRCTVKTRYRQADQPATITAIGAGRWRVVFEVPQWAVTPGQAAVFYQEEVCLGGASIDRVFHGNSLSVRRRIADN
ncbi:MAG: tRNA 2-thiouridine(34) synthase MnmA [Gammaproteobacteria bacterium]|nr:tRNA 2-thiouridine(34) synthase MnmA [Gammaproteobacteria bacterium]